MTSDEKALVERLPTYAKESLDAGLEAEDLFQWESDCERAAALIRRQFEEIDKLARALVAFAGNVRWHYDCEDNWYSCPAHPEYIGNDDSGECNCGASEHNANLSDHAAALAIAKERA